MELNKQDLDNWITGHYGEDQFRQSAYRCMKCGKKPKRAFKRDICAKCYKKFGDKWDADSNL